MSAICKITNGVESVALIGDVFYIRDWSPAGIPFKDDGYWQDSALGEGRRLAGYTHGNINETITIDQKSLSQNAAIRQVNNLSRLLLDAAEYGVKPKHGRRPVYLEVKATSESNTRYAMIHAGHVGGYGNPFSQPFLQPDCAAVVTNLTIAIERGPWLEVPPGHEVCQPIAPTGNPGEAIFYTYENILLGDYVEEQGPLITWPAFALWKLNETSGTTAFNSSVYGGLDGTHDSGNTLDNLDFWTVTDPSTFISITNGGVDIYSAEFVNRFSGTNGSLLAWINTSGLIWTGGNASYFANIQTATSYLRIFHPATPDNSITWEYNANGAAVASTQTGFTTSDEWFSVGMTWSEDKIGFYLNGQLVYADARPAAWSGSLVSTVVNIGSRVNDGTDAAVSDMAYVAIWDKPLTDTDMEIVGLPSSKFVVGFDESELDCEELVAYVGNKKNLAQLTHAFTLDASGPTFGANMIGNTPPLGLLPSTIAANDIVYFGIEREADSGLFDGPFNSLVFDILTAASATTSYTYAWEYWDGSAWSGLGALYDETDGFQETGINSVSWEQPSDWATTTINSIVAYWVRLRVTVVSGTWTQPIAQDVPYTVVWNTLDVPASEVGGSLPSLIRARIDNKSGSTANFPFSRMIMGIRSQSVAPNFNSYINLSDEQNTPGVLVSNGTNVAFQNDLTSVTGRSMRLTGGGTATLVPRVTVSIGFASAPSYFGSYKAFAIYTVQTVGSAIFEDTQFMVKVGSGYIHSVIDTGPYLVDTVSSPPYPTIHEIGEISIRPDSFIAANLARAFEGDSTDVIELSWWSTTSASLDVDFYAFVLIPTDEWFGDFSTDTGLSGAATSGQVNTNRYLCVDSTRYIDRAVVADVREIDTDLSVSRWRQSHNGAMNLQPSGRQLIHFLMAEESEDDTMRAMPHGLATVNLYRNRRYHYGRGDE